jgi:hypothetical protein
METTKCRAVATGDTGYPRGMSSRCWAGKSLRSMKCRSYPQEDTAWESSTGERCCCCCTAMRTDSGSTSKKSPSTQE